MMYRFGAVFAALVVGALPASAADLYVPVSPAMMPPAAESPAYWGAVELGGLGRIVTSVDAPDSEEGMYGGAYGAFSLWSDLGGALVGIDGYGEWLLLDDAELTNSYLGVLGAHLGAVLDPGYVGLFGAVATYPDAQDEGPYYGYAVGLEAAVEIDTTTVFGKLGYSSAPNRGGIDDEGFFGFFGEAGAMFSLTPEFAVQVHAGYGFSSPFETDDEDGYFVNWGVKSAYNLGTSLDLNLNLVASYEGLLGHTVGEEEYVIDHTFKLGLSIPFGGDGAASALNPLASPTAPFRASVMADVM